MKIFHTIIIVLFIGFTSLSQSIGKLKTGRWVGFLELTAVDKLYFELKVEKNKNSYNLSVLNGEEIVPMNEPVVKNDSVHVLFSNFNSELIFKLNNKKEIEGRWVNHLKVNYAIPFKAVLSNETIFPTTKEGLVPNFSGKWQTEFSPEKNPFAAIGVFEQKGKNLTGTFLTETGDFRFLSGNVNDLSLSLSGFDGSHAFLFVGKQNMEDGKIYGKYFSGTHYQTDWVAERNDFFELRNPDSLTKFAGDPYDFSFKFNDLNGQEFAFPNEEYKNKVVIVQILGTWCGNCMDETNYFKELYEKYHSKGLEIISVGYEIGATEEDYIKHLKAYQQHFGLKHKIVVGGSAKKSSAKADFNFLSDFTSFPTTLFIDKSGKIVRIHTGFSGPSTGKYYSDYVERTNRLIEELIGE